MGVGLGVGVGIDVGSGLGSGELGSGFGSGSWLGFAGTDADLDDVGAVDDEVLRHLVGHLRRVRARARVRAR